MVNVKFTTLADAEEMLDSILSNPTLINQCNNASREGNKWDFNSSEVRTQLINLALLVWADAPSTLDLLLAGFGPKEYRELELAAQSGLNKSQVRQLATTRWCVTLAGKGNQRVVQVCLRPEKM